MKMSTESEWYLAYSAKFITFTNIKDNLIYRIVDEQVNFILRVLQIEELLKELVQERRRLFDKHTNHDSGIIFQLENS